MTDRQAEAFPAPEDVSARLGLRPLTARSVLLSVLLGAHPPELPVKALVYTASLFGIPDGTTRVALSRMVADGDLVAESARYRLTDRLIDRQRRQDEARAAETLPWNGRWEMVIADPDQSGAPLGEELVRYVSARRMGQWREGVWGRPANLAVRNSRAALPGARMVTSEPIAEPAGLAACLWDLSGWARTAADLLAAMEGTPEPANRFTISAAVVQHLNSDPLLPKELLPPAWPGGLLRRRYAAFEAVLANILLGQR